MSFEDLDEIVEGGPKEFVKLPADGDSVDCKILAGRKRETVWVAGKPEDYDPEVHQEDDVKVTYQIDIEVPGQGEKCFEANTRYGKALFVQTLRAVKSQYGFEGNLFTITRQGIGPNTQYAVTFKESA